MHIDLLNLMFVMKVWYYISENEISCVLDPTNLNQNSINAILS